MEVRNRRNVPIFVALAIFVLIVMVIALGTGGREKTPPSSSVPGSGSAPLAFTPVSGPTQTPITPSTIDLIDQVCQQSQITIDESVQYKTSFSEGV